MRRRGIGTLLLDAMTAQAKRRGATEQWVAVTKGNYKGIPFYEHHGFVRRSEQTSLHSETGQTILSARYARPVPER
jgi:ribosomal protein S18 acetylase RimI-like enzyme